MSVSMRIATIHAETWHSVYVTTWDDRWRDVFCYRVTCCVCKAYADGFVTLQYLAAVDAPVFSTFDRIDRAVQTVYRTHVCPDHDPGDEDRA